MRAVVFVIAALGCGRISFDQAPRTGDAGTDGAVDAAAATRFYVTSGVDASNPTHVLELDVGTGELVDLGSLGLAYALGGLAAWDDNTLYATGGAMLHRITVSPLSVVVLGNVGGSISCLERDGNDLLGIDQTGNQLVRIPIATAIPTRTAITGGANVTASGGDIVQLSDGTWLWWTNGPQRLFEIDPITAVATAIGPTISSAPFISGITRDDSDRVLMTASGDDSLVEIDAKTGLLVGSTPLCSPCPAPFDLLSGDTTRAR